jgi:integrase
MDGVTRGNSKPKKFTVNTIKALKPSNERKEVRDPECRGLYVLVQPTGAKSFAVRYRFDRKPVKLTLPRGITLAAARKAAADALHEVEQGRNPSTAKRRAKEAQRVAAANTFKAVAESYLDRESKKEDAERLRSLEWRRTLLQRLVYPTLGDQPITAIKRKAIIELLDAIEDGKLVDSKGDPIKGGATMAHSTLAIVRKIMRWYAVRDEDYVVPIVPGMARIKPGERARSRVLNDDELRAVWTMAEQRSDDPFAAMVRFMLLTACRRSEAAALTRDEIVPDDIGPCWLLPTARNKVKVDLIRPLSKAVQDLLDAQPRIDDCPYFFTYGRKPLATFSQCKDEFDEACGVTGWTLHDLRRTARTLMSRAGVVSDVAEQCLGHLLSGVRKTYNRDDFKPQKRAAFDALAGLIERIVHPPADVVTPMRRKRRA